MTIDEIVKQPKVFNGVHESMFRTYHISMKIMEMINRGDSKETINETYQYMVLANTGWDKHIEEAKVRVKERQLREEAASTIKNTTTK
jgi:kynurenine formamidase